VSTHEETRRQWAHRPGDRYVVLVGSCVGNPDVGYDTSYYRGNEDHEKLGYAISEGFLDHDRSDDFNVGVIRGGALVATLWMDEIVDDEPDVLAPIARQVGLRSGDEPEAKPA
jgi:hypothetical protein